MKKILSLIFCTLFLFGAAQAQTAEVTVSLNERLFDALLDSVFTNLKAPSFPIAQRRSKTENAPQSLSVLKSTFVQETATDGASKTAKPAMCDETIRLEREIDGVRTAVRFRDGKIFAPVAFAGSYNPPFVGCVDFQGYAETNVEIRFDKEKQMIVGRAHVLNVVLSGTKGVGSSFVTKLVQGAIDKKLNPIQILATEKLSFLIPIQNAGGSLRMRATDIRTEVVSGALNVIVVYEFVKG